MYPNMKNFLDLLAIETPCVQVELHLSPVALHQWPQCRVEVNGTTLHDDVMHQDLLLDSHVPLLEPLAVAVTLHGKTYSEHQECAIVLKRFDIDGHNILDNYSQHAVYTNDHGYQDPTSYLGFNGTWNFNTTKPFYHWWHEVQGRGWLLTPHAKVS